MNTEWREDITKKGREEGRAGKCSAVLVLTAQGPNFSCPIQCLLYFLCPWDGKAGRETLVKALNPQGMTEQRKWTKNAQTGNTAHLLTSLTGALLCSCPKFPWHSSDQHLPSSYGNHFLLSYLLAPYNTSFPFLRFLTSPRARKFLDNPGSFLFSSAHCYLDFKLTSIVKTTTTITQKNKIKTAKTKQNNNNINKLTAIVIATTHKTKTNNNEAKLQSYNYFNY